MSKNISISPRWSFSGENIALFRDAMVDIEGIVRSSARVMDIIDGGVSGGFVKTYENGDGIVVFCDQKYAKHPYGRLKFYPDDNPIYDDVVGCLNGHPEKERLQIHMSNV